MKNTDLLLQPAPGTLLKEEYPRGDSVIPWPSFKEMPGGYE